MAKRNMGDPAGRRDHFHQKAKKEGFRARAVYKLQELDQDFSLFRAGDRVLDLGCAPGSWLQYAATRVGDRGVLVGIDRLPLAAGIARTRVIVGDIYDTPLAQLLGDLTAFDVVMSDMAPDTTGIRHADQSRSEALFEHALELALQTLSPGGHFVAKLFQGPAFAQLLTLCRKHFTTVKTAKPSSSRAISIEQYVVAKGFKGR